MAQPGYWVDETDWQAGRVGLTVRWTSGASGAVSTVTKKAGFGATPVTRTGVGSFTLSLAEVYADHEPSIDEIVQASYSASGACYVVVTGYNLAAKTVTVKTVTAAGAAVDPTTNDVVTVRLVMQTYTNV